MKWDDLADLDQPLSLKVAEYLGRRPIKSPHPSPRVSAPVSTDESKLVDQINQDTITRPPSSSPLSGWDPGWHSSPPLRLAAPD